MNLLNITTDQKGKPGLTRTTHLHEEESPAQRDSIMVLFLHTNPMASNPHWYSPFWEPVTSKKVGHSNPVVKHLPTLCQ
jgi:hypothetical protein